MRVFSFLALVVLGFVHDANAQYLPEGEPPAIVLEDNEAARQAISQSLQSPNAIQEDDSAFNTAPGNLPVNPAARGVKPTGDPVLDDVLEIIRKRGSILDGTSLDPANELDSNDGTQSVIIGVPGGTRFTKGGSGDATKAAPVYHAAEQLLRAARLLETLADQDESQQELIREMRSQATRLLIQTLSRVSDATPPAVNQSR